MSITSNWKGILDEEILAAYGCSSDLSDIDRTERFR